MFLGDVMVQSVGWYE